jgi:hypothetical protein
MLCVAQPWPLAHEIDGAFAPGLCDQTLMTGTAPAHFVLEREPLAHNVDNEDYPGDSSDRSAR